MEIIKTKAKVFKKNLLQLTRDCSQLELGETVNLIIILKGQSHTTRENWRHILKSIKTYSENELKEFEKVKKELDRWKPKPF